MIIPIDKLLTYKGNKYILTRATMAAVDKIGNLRGFPEDENSWKIVPNILKFVLEEKIVFEKESPLEDD